MERRMGGAAVTEIHIAAGGTMRVAPVGTDGPWIEAGYTSEGITINATFEGEPEFDIEALRCALQPRSMSWEVKTTRRQMRNLMRVMTPKTRNRRRNPLHAVRDQLRRHARGRAT
jgi:hypothetical protein